MDRQIAFIPNKNQNSQGGLKHLIPKKRNKTPEEPKMIKCQICIQSTNYC